MSALTVDHMPDNGHEWGDLVRLWEEMDWPEGCKVEIVEGIVTRSPPPGNRHNAVADLLQRSLYPALPREWGIYQTLGIAVPARQGMFVPDLVVAPRVALEAPGNQVSATEAELIVEITSKGNAGADRISKPAAYAAAGVPLYLLVDGWAPGGPTITLHGEPKGEVYRTLRAGKFGEGIPLPAPFGLTVDTSDFPDFPVT